MGFPHLEQKASVQPAKNVAPGSYETGFEYADKGSACERTPAVGQCMLRPDQRGRLVQELTSQIHYSLDNYEQALANTRVELLLQKDSGWGFVTELIVSVLSTVLLAGVGALAAKFAAKVVTAAVESGEIAAADFDTALKAHQALFTGSVKQVLSAAKTPLRSRLAGYSQQTLDRVAFITDLQSSATHVFSEIEQRAKLGDDAQLIYARAAMDQEHLSVNAFKDQIDDALARFSASHLDDLGWGPGPITAEYRVTRFVRGTMSRLAVVNFRTRRKLGTSHGDDWYTPGGNVFMNWIDDDLAEAAVAIQGQHGSGMATIDLEDDPSWLNNHAIWAGFFGGAR